jgi:hypothetical protein
MLVLRYHFIHLYVKTVGKQSYGEVGLGVEIDSRPVELEYPRLLGPEIGREPTHEAIPYN